MLWRSSQTRCGPRLTSIAIGQRQFEPRPNVIKSCSGSHESRRMILTERPIRLPNALPFCRMASLGRAEALCRASRQFRDCAEREPPRRRAVIGQLRHQTDLHAHRLRTRRRAMRNWGAAARFRQGFGGRVCKLESAVVCNNGGNQPGGGDRLPPRLVSPAFYPSFFRPCGLVHSGFRPRSVHGTGEGARRLIRNPRAGMSGQGTEDNETG